MKRQEKGGAKRVRGGMEEEGKEKVLPLWFSIFFFFEWYGAMGEINFNNAF